MLDLLTLHDKNPEQAAQQLIKHIQSKAIDPADVKSTFQPRDDWRYHARKDREEPELTGGYNTNSAQRAVQQVATGPGAVARAATLAKAGIDKLSNLGKTARIEPTVKDMGPVQQVKSSPALPAPIKPEVEVPVNVKQKQKVGQGVAEK